MDPLGLRRGTVRLVPHDSRWKKIFAEKAAAIRQRTGLPEDRVHHVGSTAVEGLPAKPILDIVVGLERSESVEQIVTQLAALGYIDRGTSEGSIGRLLISELEPEVRTIHLHIVQFRAHDWWDYLDFRDALIHDPELRNRYGALKNALAERHQNDRRSYTGAKEEFIREVLTKCRERRPRNGLSPDGRWLAVTRRQPARLYEVWLLDLSRGTASPFATGRIDGGAVWSPDAERLAWSRGTDLPPQVYVKPIAGDGEAERLTNELPAVLRLPTDWSRSGRYILYDQESAGPTGYDIYVLDLESEGGPSRPYLATTASERHGVLSPDERLVAYVSDVTGVPQECP